MAKLNVVLISTYELGRQPFGLASPAAWLREAGASVTCFDLAVEHLEEEAIAVADMVGFYVPMHTATRIAVSFVHRVKEINPRAHLCFYGLYAPVNEGFLREIGADTILGGEFEEGLIKLAERLSSGVPSLIHQPDPVVSLARQQFLVPDRNGLPELPRYAHLILADGRSRVVGNTEASRGCKNLCRHCPIVPVYGGRFFIVQPEVVLADIEQQVAAGAHHITFGDPDFFNGPTHAMRVVEELHRKFPGLTYDVTIKVEHLLKHAAHLPRLRDTGCLFITSAVEAVDNDILEIFDKRHTREDFIRVVSLFRETGIYLNPTFVTFSPWISLSGYMDLLKLIRELDLVGSVSPIQYAIRLLIPAGSRLLELPAVQDLVGEFDPAAMIYPWAHPDPRVDRLHAAVLKVVSDDQVDQEDRASVFAEVWALTEEACSIPDNQRAEPVSAGRLHLESIPHLSEPWYCCAEPTELQMAPRDHV
ncbi:MAG TPA: CUAEP/CCAEP-tail radical SAM protein [Thermomicrobiales bacterium]|nr:CUAEP/CCAEP-tail radical SAM protein [Thermomicrobiales bacterium]